MAYPHGHFVWYELVTTDVDAAKAFYVDVMGWGARDVSTPGMAFTLFTVGGAPVSGLMALPEPARKMGAGARWAGYVGVDDLDAAAGLIQRLGGAFHGPPTVIPDTSRFSAFSDPQTATLGLLQATDRDHLKPPKLNAPGQVGWHELIAADCDKALAFYGEVFGWRQADGDNPAGTYGQFSVDGKTIGGMIAKPPTVPASFWHYYFNVADIDVAATRVTANGGQILDSPLESPGGAWIVQCIDPQGAVFALAGAANRNSVGYFERPASRDPSNPRGRRWSW